eukprot:TRINITY_DN57945_c0_g1_i1.p1 TRINITY_DN57945_c0_g1~~TRINITY_DN57945_c0_g1_i1.p1  ORF type:complete len:883 (-),score=181.63 TRINITY_DN57945_c0_g1_i1:52-2700(-)
MGPHGEDENGATGETDQTLREKQEEVEPFDESLSKTTAFVADYLNVVQGILVASHDRIGQFVMERIEAERRLATEVLERHKAGDISQLKAERERLLARITSSQDLPSDPFQLAGTISSIKDVLLEDTKVSPGNSPMMQSARSFRSASPMSRPERRPIFSADRRYGNAKVLPHDNARMQGPLFNSPSTPAGQPQQMHGISKAHSANDPHKPKALLRAHSSAVAPRPPRTPRDGAQAPRGSIQPANLQVTLPGRANSASPGSRSNVAPVNHSSGNETPTTPVDSPRISEVSDAPVDSKNRSLFHEVKTEKVKTEKDRGEDKSGGRKTGVRPGKTSDRLPLSIRRASVGPTKCVLHAGDNTDDETPKKDGTKEVKSKGKQGVFADATAMKEQVRQNLVKKEYNVADFYFKTGYAQSLARHPVFEQVTLAVIAFNAIWIWIDADFNTADTLMTAHPLFQVMEHSFCVFFTCELIIRFSAFEKKRNCCRDRWYVFDSFLVTIMVAETWGFIAIAMMTGAQSGSSAFGDASVLRLFRLMRLTRMARMAKLLWAMPELMILIKGMVVASRSVMFTLSLLMLVHYVIGIMFKQLTAGHPDIQAKYFSTVPHAMSSLMLYGCFGENMPEVVQEIGSKNLIYAFIFMMHVLLANLTVMNMLVGVLCEVVSVVSSVEKEQMVVNYVKTKLMEMVQEFGIDEDQNHQISKYEFQKLVLRPDAARVIQEVGVDVVGLVDFADFIFKGDVELSFGDFMSVVLQLRGSNTATVKDIVDLRKYMDASMEEVKESLVRYVTALEHVMVRTVNERMNMNMDEDVKYSSSGGRPVPSPALPSFTAQMWANEQKNKPHKIGGKPPAFQHVQKVQFAMGRAVNATQENWDVDVIDLEHLQGHS